ncbi:aspartate aminotransferase family protein [Halobacillus salinarum]|uniref:Aspartate aminotransferase family protein n=1 Tax=Halobacillus salinarum TaxID=2932257 RepID=A0ABY4EIR1_9BACI|nr:aspartate aminotransferase family protein [Halobacillus salinarum]UOQ43932.1 aspartate aminotransferase family protein [Halobacillus salinarum]
MPTQLNQPTIISNIEHYDDSFLHHGKEGLDAFQLQMQQVSTKLQQVFASADQPFVGKSHQTIRKEIEQMMDFSMNGSPLESVLDEIEDPILKNGIFVSHEKSMAHLHCPPLLPGIAADTIISALNQSMDSWDQSPAATYVEAELVHRLKEMACYPKEADGVFTTGGTQSNYMGILLARDAFCAEYWGVNVQQQGLPEGFQRLRILCSEEAHFTVKQAASQLGLGERAVVTVASDEKHQISLTRLEEALARLEKENALPFAIVGTCGTTDFGSIDPMAELAETARKHKIWLHIDAAFGGGLMLSHNHFQKLNGLNQADSMTIDFHKMFYQPISCGVFLVKDQTNFASLCHHADYLNPLKDDEEGILNLVNKSVQTTRRFDALKVYITLKTIGSRRLGNMIDSTLEMAKYAADYIAGKNEFEVENRDPELNTVVFQYQPSESRDYSSLNRRIQQEMLQQGKAVLAKTTINEKTFLKFTLLNPRTRREDIETVVGEIEKVGNTLVNGGFK